MGFFWIVPSKIVAHLIKTSHEIWKKTLGRKGRTHQLLFAVFPERVLFSLLYNSIPTLL